MEDKLKEARKRLASACEVRDAAYKALGDAPDDVTTEDLDALNTSFDTAQEVVERENSEVGRIERIIEARKNTPTIVIDNDDDGTRFATPKGGKQEHTYKPGGPSFFTDIKLANEGDSVARERLDRHEQETRDISTVATAGGGFVPPIYLGELFADVPRPARPFADAIPKMTLPNVGMNITIPRITTGAAVAVTTADNAAVNEVDLVEATVTIPVRTIAGQQDVSQQLLDRSQPNIDQVIFKDLRSSYDQQLDTGLIGGSGAAGQVLGIRTVSGVNTSTYVDATPTAAELLPRIYNAIQLIASTRFAPPDTIVMHPRRAAWLASQLSTSFPLFQQGNLYQAAGTQDKGLLTTFAGLRVVLDASISTTLGAGTEDEIYVLRADDLILMESGLQSRVLPGVLSGTLTVRLQLFGYVAFISARYPTAIAIISGTGLIAPTF